MVRMQLIFSVFSLIAIVGLIMWWSVRDAVTVPPVSTDDTESSVQENSNGISDPIRKAEEAKQLIESKNLIALDLSSQGLTKVPEYIFERVDLQSLNLSHNNLTGALQAEIRHLQNLIVLDLSDNNFTGVPAEVGQLKNLEILDLSNNNLTGLPYELGNLSHLKMLDLSGNQYSEADLVVIKKSLPTTTVIKTE